MRWGSQRDLSLFALLSLTILTGCDDGTLPLAEYKIVDVNAYFYLPDNKEIYLGKKRGAQSCGQMSHS